MRRGVARLKGVGFLLWHTRHEFYHVLLGLVWAWFLRELWNEFNPRWIWWSVVGSLVPDAEHLVYFLSYGRHDWYSQQVRNFLKARRWRATWLLVEQGHKQNTNLMFHNYFVMAFLFLLAATSSLFEWQVGVILFGAMLMHYFFDVLDDLLQLGAINPNWKRWGRKKKVVSG